MSGRARMTRGPTSISQEPFVTSWKWRFSRACGSIPSQAETPGRLGGLDIGRGVPKRAWLTLRNGRYARPIGDPAGRRNRGVPERLLDRALSAWCARASCGMMVAQGPILNVMATEMVATLKQGRSRFEALQHASQLRRRGGLKRCR